MLLWSLARSAVPAFSDARRMWPVCTMLVRSWQMIHDNTNMVSRNIRGLFSNLSAAIRGRHQVICLQETDIAEYSTPDLIAQASTAGYSIHFGNTCPLGRDASKATGRRVAITLKPEIGFVSGHNRLLSVSRFIPVALKPWQCTCVRSKPEL